jgi:hypothetical protein
MPDSAIPDCFGPYLRYAFSTEFRHFEFFDERGFKLFLLVEFYDAGKQDEFVGALKTALSHPGTPQPFVELGPTDDKIPLALATLRTQTTAVTPFEREGTVFKLWKDYVSRVELSLPVKVSEPGPDGEKRKITKRYQQEDASKPLLIGMMDDGCPFAAAQFLGTLPDGSVGTRVRAIWDQNRNRHTVLVGARSFGQPLSDFNFGLEYRRPTFAGTQIGLNEWISMHSTAGLIDEDGCYADADFKRLASQQSHGAHVMDLLAGQTPISSRLGPSSDRRDPPSWAPGRPSTDPASDADVVFVQFSNDCIRDATGVWLKAYVWEGIRYIMSFADPDVTENVVINLSYGPTTGPHDGTAELEAGLLAIVTAYDGCHRSRAIRCCSEASSFGRQCLSQR